MSKLSWSARVFWRASLCADQCPNGRESIRALAAICRPRSTRAAGRRHCSVPRRRVRRQLRSATEGRERLDHSAGEPSRHGVPSDSRIGPQQTRFLAAIRSPNGQPALRTAARAHHWRLELLEFRPSPSVDATLVEFGTSAQATLEVVPRDLVVDRCFPRGSVSRAEARTCDQQRSDDHRQFLLRRLQASESGSQAIAGWNGPGPFVIENNYLEGSGVTFLLGGADPSIPGLIPSDVTFRRNLVSRPEAWREERWSVKNLFELKNARRVLVEENIFENNWLSAQVGFAILMTVANSNGRAFWVTVEDVTFRHNVVRHAGGGLNILGRDQHGDPSGVARGIRISGNLFYDIDKERWGGQETSCRSCTGRRTSSSSATPSSTPAP